MTAPKAIRILLPAAFAVTAGCAAGTGSNGSISAALPIVHRGSASQYISHVVVIVQENRSFENFFAGYPYANAPMSGCAEPPKALPRRVVHRRTGSGNCPPGDTAVPLHKITFAGPDLAHNWPSSKLEYDNGSMDGFSRAKSKQTNAAYAYVNPTLIAPYWSMAQQYVLADEMFPTEWGGSFTGHLTLVAGNDAIDQSPEESEVDFPNGTYDDCDSPYGTKSSYVTANKKEHLYKGPFPCFTQFNTIAQVLDNGGISWKYYATKVLDDGMWEPFEAISYVRYGSDWGSNIVAPQTQVLFDPGNNQLASVTWVTPEQAGLRPSDLRQQQRPVVGGIGRERGRRKSVLEYYRDRRALGRLGRLVRQRAAAALDYRGLGFRVPCLIISPYAKQNYVDHTQYEFGSVLKFIEEVYGLPSIGPPSEGYSDQRATSLDNAFDFTQQPRQFVPIQATVPKSYFLREPPSNEPVDTE